MFDQVGLVRAQPVTLAPAEEGAMRVNDGSIVGRGIAIAGIANRGTHRGSNALMAVSMLSA
jgi:hypothetical protein